MRRTDEEIEEFWGKLRRIDNRTDNRLLWWLVPAGAVAFACKKFGVESRVLEVVLGGLVVGGLGIHIWSVVRIKREAARRVGLKCPSCGRVPLALEALAAIKQGTCWQCGAPLAPAGVPNKSHALDAQETRASDG
jgi:hypothetical protein